MKFYRNKYRAIPTVINGIHFASKREGCRYSELLLEEKAGKITGLSLQPAFKFPMGFSYKGDFRYKEKGQDTVEDVKGFETAVFKLKKKCFLHFFPEISLKITK